MITELWWYLAGYVWLELEGADIAGLINRLVAAGLRLRTLGAGPEGYRLQLALADFFRLRPLVRGAGVRIRVVGRGGAPFTLARLRQRPLLWVGALVVLALLGWTSQVVWVVDVQGTSQLDPRAVLAVAAELGLRRGVLKTSLDTAAVEQAVPEQLAQVAWLGVKVQGTRVVLQVVEKVQWQAPEATGRQDLVASKGGLVEQLVVLKGHPVVQEGDYVKAGEPLILGELRAYTGGRPALLPGTPVPEPEGVVATFPAEGRVLARIYHEQEVVVPLLTERPLGPGRRLWRLGLAWQGQEIIGKATGEIPYASYEGELRRFGLPGWRNQVPAVEVLFLKAVEQRFETEHLTPDAALARLEAEVRQHYGRQLGPGDRLDKIEITPLGQEQDALGRPVLRCKLLVETVEEIARRATP